jgi:endonuclease-3
MNNREKMRRVLAEFKRRYKIKEEHGAPFETLIRTIISQRNTDVSTDKVSKRLFSVAKTPQDLAKLPLKRLQSILKPAGTWRQKAKYIHNVSKLILAKHSGKVPKNRQQLIELPGVGPKTADIVLMYGFGIPSIAVDTHCNRIPRRLGLVGWKEPIHAVKETLERLTPRKDWYAVNHGFVSFGQETCRAVNPRCNTCPFLKFCPFGQKRINGLKRDSSARR